MALRSSFSRKDRLRRVVGRSEAGDRFGDADGLRRARAERVVRTPAAVSSGFGADTSGKFGIRGTAVATFGRLWQFPEGRWKQEVSCRIGGFSRRRRPSGRRCRHPGSLGRKGGHGRSVLPLRRLASASQEEETAFQFQGTRRPGIRDVARSQGRIVREPEPVDRQQRLAAPCGFRFRKGYRVCGVKTGYSVAAGSRG